MLNCCSISTQFPNESKEQTYSTRTMRITNVPQHFNFIWFQAFWTFRAFQATSIAYTQINMQKEITKHHEKSERAVEIPQNQQNSKKKPKNRTSLCKISNYENSGAKLKSTKYCKCFGIKSRKIVHVDCIFRNSHEFWLCSHFAFKCYELFTLTTTWSPN